MEIRSINKKTQKTNLEQESEPEKRKSGDEPLALEKPKNVKDSAQKEAQQWTRLMTVLGFTLLIGNPLVGMLVTLLAGVKITQHDQQIRQDRKQRFNEHNLSLQKNLPKFFESLDKTADIKSLFTEPQYEYLSFLISLDSSPNLALASLALTPAYQGKAEVFYYFRKKQLAYKKPNIRMRFFSPDPLEQFSKDLKTLEINEPALDTSSLIYILVLSDTITLSDSDCDQLGEVRYLHLKGIYLVEKSGLETLMTHLISPQLESTQVTTPSSEKETALSKTPIRLVKKPSPHPQKELSQKSDNLASKQREDSQSLSESQQDDLIAERFPYTLGYIDAIWLLLICVYQIGQSHSFFFSGFWHSYCFNNFSDLSTIMSSAIAEEIEYRIADRLVQKLARPGMTFYSILDDSKVNLESIQQGEMILHLPPDRVFVIFVKNLISTTDKSVKVFYDPAIESLRYRKGNRGKKNFSTDPILNAQQRSKWLLEHEPELIPHPPIPIVVFSDNVILKHHTETPLQLYGKREFILHQGVYVVEEKKLPSLIMMLTPKPETTRRSK